MASHFPPMSSYVLPGSPTQIVSPRSSLLTTPTRERQYVLSLGMQLQRRASKAGQAGKGTSDSVIASGGIGTGRAVSLLGTSAAVTLLVVVIAKGHPPSRFACSWRRRLPCAVLQPISCLPALPVVIVVAVVGIRMLRWLGGTTRLDSIRALESGASGGGGSDVGCLVEGRRGAAARPPHWAQAGRRSTSNWLEVAVRSGD